MLGASGAANVQTSGVVTLDAANGVVQSGGSIRAGGLRLLGAGAFDLNLAANDIATLAANITGAASALTYRDANGFAIGTVGATSGIALGTGAANVVTLNGTGDITFNTAISAGAATINAGTGNLVNAMVGGTQIDTSAANGAISLSADRKSTRLNSSHT